MFKYSKLIRLTKAALLFMAAFVVLSFWGTKADVAYAMEAPKKWDGGGAGALWSNALNWTDNVLPTTAKTVIFDNTCVSNCSATIDIPVEVEGIDINSGYAGTITQGSGAGITITVGTENFDQAAGTFIPSANGMRINGEFILSGGTFNASVGNPEIYVTENVTISDAATFTKGTGTIHFIGDATQVITDTSTIKKDLGSISVDGNYPGFGTDGNITFSEYGDDSLNAVAIDASYIYSVGTKAGECVKSGSDCWRLEKRDITTGALVTAFGDNGVIETDPTAGHDNLTTIAVDGSYIYLAGQQAGNFIDGEVCYDMSQCWRIEKRDKTTGALVTAFDSDGVIISEFPFGYATIQSIAIDSSYMYLAGSQYDVVDGGCSAGRYCWRVEKRNITTGALVTAFDTNGVLHSNPEEYYDGHLKSIVIDASYIYLGGYQYDVKDGGCSAGKVCWRIEKRDITTGALVTAFDTNGIAQSAGSGYGDYIYSMAVDATYLYVGGVQHGVLNGGCTASNYCWRIEKRNKTTGALVTAFDTDGILHSNPANASFDNDILRSLNIDASYIYLAGVQQGVGGGGCASGENCWRIEKRDITSGALVTAFDTDGIVISNPASSSEYVNASTIDSSYIYIGGYQSGAVAGDCQTVGTCWRLEKRNITTGALVTAFDAEGVVNINGAESSFTTITTIAKDDNYIYLGGAQTYPTNDCDEGYCWRIEKREKASGDLVTAFDTDGVLLINTVNNIEINSIVVDSSYIYIAGAHYSEVDAECDETWSCWHLEKRDITTGALVTAFSADGIVLSDPMEGYEDSIETIVVDSLYVYLGGFQSGVADGGCVSEVPCWRIEKRDITTGALVNAFSTDGIIVSNPNGGTSQVDTILVDASYLYIGGFQTGASDGGCALGSACWRIEKRDKTTGALVTAFSTDGIVQSDPTSSYDAIQTMVMDSSYLYIGGFDDGGSGECDLGGACWRVEKRDKTTGALVTAFSTDGVVRNDISYSQDYVSSVAIDSTYIYLAGYIDSSDVGDDDECYSAQCWAVEKRDITTGALIASFGGDGIIESDKSFNNDYLYTMVIDSESIYLAGQTHFGLYGGLEKRDIVTGELEAIKTTILELESSIAASEINIGEGQTWDVSGTNTITLSGDFNNSGTFEASTGTLVLNGVTPSVITGATTFNNFTSATDNKVIQFEALETFVFEGVFTLTGTVGDTIHIESTIADSQWLAHFNSAQTGTVVYATVTDSGCDLGSANVTLTSSSVNGGNNDACWLFVSISRRYGSGAVDNGDGGGEATGGGDDQSGGGDTDDGDGGGTPTGGGEGQGGGSGGSP